MAEDKKEAKGYTIGEVATQTAEVITRPDGSIMTDKQWQIEVISKLDAIYKLMKNNL